VTARHATAARVALKRWLDAQGSGSVPRIAATLEVSVPAVYQWLAGTATPRPVLRRALARLTRGAVAEDAWLTDDERFWLSELEERLKSE
jgi:hypothetical protein